MSQASANTVEWGEEVQQRAFWIPLDESIALRAAVAADRSESRHLHSAEWCLVYREEGPHRTVEHLARTCPPGLSLEVPEVELDVEVALEEEPPTEVEAM